MTNSMAVYLLHNKDIILECLLLFQKKILLLLCLRFSRLISEYILPKKNSSDEYSSESSTHEITNMIWINLSVA
jgi:hypothetical protein